VEDDVTDDDGTKDKSAEPLGVDLSAWEAQAPPADFAERVLGRVLAEPGAAARDTSSAAPAPAAQPTAASRARRPMRLVAGGGVAAALALAAAFALRVSAVDARGEAIAQDRVEVAIGNRATAVLERGAHVKWNGDDVVQGRGDVFYRVERGARFTVHTPAGDVEVKGTCFAVKVRGDEKNVEVTEMDKRDVKSGAVGAALTALAFVAVYEGKVAVSHASERVDLAAGESAQVGAQGVQKGAVAEGEKSFEAKVAAQGAEPSAEAANKNLVAQVGEYRQRLEAIAAQKAELEQKLKATEDKLATSADGGVKKAEFDLGPEDYAELAKQGKIAYRVPCDGGREGWTPSPEKLQQLGLAPSDAPIIKDAYAKSGKRVWAQIGPLCAAALGGNAAVAEKLGTATCQHLVYDIEMARDREAAAEALTQASEIRAGLRPEPKPGEKVNPVLAMFLALTGANKAFEADLAQAFGPEEAHRLVHASEMCNSDNRWGGGKKRAPASSDGEKH